MQRTKRIARALAAAGLAIVMTVGTAFASYGTGTVTADALRMRSKPNTGSSILTTLYKGTKVEILSAEENGWYKVSYNGKEGYMSADWLNVVVTASTQAPSTAPSEEPPAEDPPAQEPAAEEPAVITVNSTAVVTDGPLNIRTGPGTGYDKAGLLLRGDKVTVLEILDGWYKVSAKGSEGYVSARFIAPDTSGSSGTQNQTQTQPQTQVKTQNALVLSGPLNVRSGPGTSYTRVGSLKVGTTVTVIGKSGQWYQIKYANLTGYVHSDYVTLMEELSSSPAGQAAAALAISLIGSRYVYGAEGPTTFDCSGLAYYIYKQLGYTIARGSSSQYKNSGRFVPLSEMEPGDLIYFFDPKYDGSGGTLPTTHMGIYVGNGRFVHASTTTYRVQYDNVYNSYYTKYIVGVKRIG